MNPAPATIDDSLRRLQLDYVDLYQIHRFDHHTPIEETLAALTAVVDRITEVARQRGVPNAQIALAWLLHQPGVTAPIIGASKPQHLKDAAKALELKLGAEELQRLAEPYQPHRVLGHA